MDKLIKQMRKILGNHYSSEIHISITQDELWFEIYESRLPIIIDLKKGEVYLDCETCNNHLTSDMLHELAKISKLLEENVDLFVKIMKGE